MLRIDSSEAEEQDNAHWWGSDFLVSFAYPGKRWQSDTHVNIGLLAINCALLAAILAFATRIAITSAADAPEVGGLDERGTELKANLTYDE